MSHSNKRPDDHFTKITQSSSYKIQSFCTQPEHVRPLPGPLEPLTTKFNRFMGYLILKREVKAIKVGRKTPKIALKVLGNCRIIWNKWRSNAALSKVSCNYQRCYSVNHPDRNTDNIPGQHQFPQLQWKKFAVTQKSAGMNRRVIFQETPGPRGSA